MSKKVLLIIGIVAIIGVAAFLALSATPKSEEGGSRVGFSIRDYLPFGRSDDLGTGDNMVIEREDPTDITETVTSRPVPRLRKLSSEPAAGAVAFNVGTTTVIRFIEKGTGNVYEAKSNSVSIERLTNTTIPKIVRALWLPNGSGFVAQTLLDESEIIETSFVRLSKAAASSTVENFTPFNTTISKLPTNIKEVAVRPDGAKIFYYTTTSSSNWFVSNPDGTASTQVYSHPLTEWVPKWTSANTITMHTKKSSGMESFSYLFDVANKTLRKGVSDQALMSKMNTLSEKCVESKDKKPTLYCAIPNKTLGSNFPDAWYKGLASTEDFIEKVDVNNDVFYNIADLSNISGQKIDVVDLSISPDESHLIFKNKIDGYLWVLRIEEGS